MRFAFALFLFLPLWAFPQAEESVMIELKPPESTFKNSMFYIANVVDHRKDTGAIGFVRQGVYKEKVPARLKGGTEKAVSAFIDQLIPRQTEWKPLFMLIETLQIAEDTSAVAIGEARMQADFYGYDEHNRTVLVYQAESAISEPLSAGDGGHEQRIRRVITDCLRQLVTSSWQEKLWARPPDAPAASSGDSGIVPFRGIIMNRHQPRYSHQGKTYKSLDRMKTVILASPDDKVHDLFRTYRADQGAATFFGFIGGGLLGYGLGGSLAGAKYGTLFWVGSGTSFLIGLAFQGAANKKAKQTVRRYNKVCCPHSFSSSDED